MLITDNAEPIWRLNSWWEYYHHFLEMKYHHGSRRHPYWITVPDHRPLPQDKASCLEELALAKRCTTISSMTYKFNKAAFDLAISRSWPYEIWVPIHGVAGWWRMRAWMHDNVGPAGAIAIARIRQDLDHPGNHAKLAFDREEDHMMFRLAWC